MDLLLGEWFAIFHECASVPATSWVVICSEGAMKIAIHFSVNKNTDPKNQPIEIWKMRFVVCVRLSAFRIDTWLHQILLVHLNKSQNLFNSVLFIHIF